MSLTRFLPTPSDRMRDPLEPSPIDGCVVLEYGPAGTTHFSMSLFGELGGEPAGPPLHHPHERR